MPEQLPQVPQRDQQIGTGWALFVGVLLALTLVKEMLRQLAANPVTVRARDAAGMDTALGISAVAGVLKRIGGTVLRV